MVQRPAFQAIAESLKLIEDLALSAKVKANLSMIAPKLQVRADEGRIYINNFETRTDSEWLDKIKQAASRIEGVKEVTFDVSSPREQHDHINPFHNIG